MKKEEIEVFSEDKSIQNVLNPDCIEKHRFNKTELEREITAIVNEVIKTDIRLNDTPEVREAIRDYVRIEFIFARKIEQAVNKPDSITTADERMIRSAAKLKQDGRDEIWGQVKSKPGQEREMELVRESVSKKVIKAGKEVDPIG